MDSARHTYKLVWGSDGHYQIFVDSELIVEGPICGHFFTQKMIRDPSDEKPFEWDDEPYLISDELRYKIQNTKEMDEETLTINSEYIDLIRLMEDSPNPNYKGVWQPRLIPAPNQTPFSDKFYDDVIVAAGF